MLSIVRSRVFIIALSVLAIGSAFAHPVGHILPRPDQTKQLMRANGFQLKRVSLELETKVLVFFYSASWCGPCKQAMTSLEAVYPSLRKAHPELEFVTFSIDRSVSERAGYLRDTKLPWLAISPSALKEETWQALIPRSTPEFQAFEITDAGLRVLSNAGTAADVLQTVSEFLEHSDASSMRSSASRRSDTQ